MFDVEKEVTPVVARKPNAKVPMSDDRREATSASLRLWEVFVRKMQFENFLLFELEVLDGCCF